MKFFGALRAAGKVAIWVTVEWSTYEFQVTPFTSIPRHVQFCLKPIREIRDRISFLE